MAFLTCFFLCVCEKGDHKGFFRHDGYLFKDKILCLPKISMQELMIREAHEDSLMRHFGVEKTLAILHKHFFWPKMKHDVIKTLCQIALCVIKLSLRS